MLQDDIATELPGLREQAESLMVDTCRITKPGEGEPVFNNDTGQYDPPPRVEVYGPATAPKFGKCRLQVSSAVSGPQGTESGGREWVVQTSIAQLPIDGSGSVRSGHILELTVSAYDPATVGRKFTIVGRGTTKTHATKREFEVSEVTG